MKNKLKISKRMKKFQLKILKIKSKLTKNKMKKLLN